MQSALEIEPDGWDFFVNIGQDDYPIASAQEIQSYFSSISKDTNFIMCWPIQGHNFFGQWERHEARVLKVVATTTTTTITSTTSTSSPRITIYFTTTGSSTSMTTMTTTTITFAAAAMMAAATANTQLYYYYYYYCCCCCTSWKLLLGQLVPPELESDF